VPLQLRLRLGLSRKSGYYIMQSLVYTAQLIRKRLVSVAKAFYGLLKQHSREKRIAGRKLVVHYMMEQGSCMTLVWPSYEQDADRLVIRVYSSLRCTDTNK